MSSKKAGRKAQTQKPTTKPAAAASNGCYIGARWRASYEVRVQGHLVRPGDIYTGIPEAEATAARHWQPVYQPEAAASADLAKPEPQNEAGPEAGAEATTKEG